ncbi:MAG: RHS repeat-associated core domain-containing protein, partial [Blastocatellia bacterium]
LFWLRPLGEPGSGACGQTNDPIQTITVEQSGGVPTNRIASVTNNGSTVNYTYDAGGNVTNDGAQAYTYDAENRVVSVDGGATAEYRYDHQNRRVSKTVGSIWTHYVWEGAQVIGEHDATTAYSTNPTYQVKSARLDYVYVGARMIHSRQRASSIAPWTTRYYLSDRLSVRMTLDNSGNVSGRQAHLPFGEDFGESGTQEKHHFANYEREGESALDYSVNRWYSSSLGRFLSVDPVIGTGPQKTNRYGYSMNDPTNLFDPDGRNIYYLSCHANIWWTFTDGDPQAHAKGEICEVVDLGPAFISQPPDKSKPKKPRPFTLARLKECAESLFGVTMDSFTRAKGGKNGGFSGNGPDTVSNGGDYAGFTVTIDVSINSAGLVAMYNQRPGPQLPPGSKLRGAWFPDIPYTAFVASDLSTFDQKPSIAVQMHELGNALAGITGVARDPAPPNPENSDTDAGVRMERCMFGGTFNKDGSFTQYP